MDMHSAIQHHSLTQLVVGICMKAYGKTTYLITTLQLVPRGTEGAVSLEGTLAGLGAAAVFAASSLAVGQVGAAQLSYSSCDQYQVLLPRRANVQARPAWGLTGDCVIPAQSPACHVHKQLLMQSLKSKKI